MENFGKFKDWLLNILVLATFGGIVSIKSDLAEVKEKLPLHDYRIIKLEESDKEKKKRDDEQDKELAKLNGFILPDRITVKKKVEEPLYD